MNPKNNPQKYFTWQKCTAVWMLFVLLFSVFTVSAAAQGGNVQYPYGVTEEMCSAVYWAQRAKNADEVMMTPQEIDAYNSLTAHTEGTFVKDLEELETVYDATALRDTLASDVRNKNKDRDLFVDGVKIDNASYFDALSRAVTETGWTGEREIVYGVCTTRCDLMAIPTEDVIGYSVSDADSEYQDSALNVNDPVVIQQICTHAGGTFYYVQTDHYLGWASAQAIGVCADRAEWLDAWKTRADSTDILVVTQNQIVTEPSILVPETANIKLTFGTVLKLVPEDKIPQNLGERYAWNSYVVYLPVRDADGAYVKKEALISQHYSVSIGYLPMTQAEILRVAFQCLGDRYGWGGMLDAMDCSLYTRNVYRCFGLYMPRNTTWQQLVPNTKLDVSGMTEEEKLAVLRNTPAGALLYFPGHTMIYTGYEADMGYVISALGSAADSVGEPTVKSVYSVALNPLSVRRRNGATWLTNLTSIVIPANCGGTKYDPANPTDDAHADVCLLCGKVHTGTFGQIVRIVHKIVYTVLHWFGVRFPAKEAAHAIHK